MFILEVVSRVEGSRYRGVRHIVGREDSDVSQLHGIMTAYKFWKSRHREAQSKQREYCLCDTQVVQHMFPLWINLHLLTLQHLTVPLSFSFLPHKMHTHFYLTHATCCNQICLNL